MSSGSAEDAALALLAKASAVPEDSDPLGLSSLGSGDVATPLRPTLKRDPGGNGSAQPPSVLRQKEVSEEVWEDDWKDSTKYLEDWRGMFQAATVDNLVTDKVRLKVETDRVIESKLFKTPGKHVKTSFVDSKLEEFSPYKEALRTPAKVSAFKAKVADKTLGTLVPLIDKGLGEVAKTVEVLTEESRSLMLSFEDNLEKLSSKVQSLTDGLGIHRQVDASVHVAPTVWGSIGTLSSALNGKSDIGDSVTQDELRLLRDEMIEEGIKSQDATVQGIAIVKQTFLSIVTPLVTQIQTLEGPGAQTCANIPGAQQSTSNPVAARVGKMEGEMDGLNEALAKLETRMDEVKAEREDKAIKFAGIGISSIEEMGAWVETHFEERAFGLIMDPYLLLHLVVGKDTNQKSLLDAMKRRKDLDINTEADAKALAALLHEVPEMLHNAASDDVGAADQASYLSNLKTHDQWGVGSRSMKKVIEKRVVQIKTSMMQRIRKEFNFSSRAYSVALEALEKSVTWLGNLISFIDRTFESVHVHLESRYSKKQAWALTTQLVRRVWNDMYAVRLGALDNMTGDQHSMCMAVLWSVFRTHDIMEAYELANFDDHPSISSEYVKFLATNSGFEVMEELKKEVSELKNKNSEWKQKVGEYKRAADSAASTAGEYKSQLAELQRRLTVLEKKK